MLSLLGNPRDDYDTVCREITNPSLRAKIRLQDVGPFRVRGIAPAVESLEQVLIDVRAEVPDVHAGLGTAGMLCARLVRGSTSSISNHSWGTAIDLTLDGVLDQRGDGTVQEGLARIAPIFNRHGWFWGAAFRTEDAMHFEVSDQLIRRWHGEGRLGVGRAAPAMVLNLGDRGPEVVALQRRLNELGASLVVDGDFGPATRAVVVAFQAQAGLVPDGMVGSRTSERLGLG
ncbi:peptidoglycan-binding protein [Geminicoccus roseus]|uniref:peptidoglycan-binding protein n=1 Tax=Geminicoccus roseus TaxID=404900 RepID=UPI0004179077|nr:peptidoglycan-binding protein [Geminicoccus roseus]